MPAPDNPTQPVPNPHSQPVHTHGYQQTIRGPFPTAPYRASDDDRARAINMLARHFAAGRITMSEYDDRVSEAASAVRICDLNIPFQDLPPLGEDELEPLVGPQRNAGDVTPVALPPASLGRNYRAGIMMLSIIVAMVLTNALHEDMMMLLVPVVAVLLYVIKVGPESWHSGSRLRQQRRAVRRQQRDMLQAKAVELELERKARASVRREEHAAMKAQAQALSTEAMSLAQNALARANDRLTGGKRK